MKNKNKKLNTYLLEATSLKELKKVKEDTKKLLKYHARYYSELAEQRILIQDKLIEALIQPSTSFEFSGWQRAVKYRYGLHPMSVAGSLIHIGGRFNTGRNVNIEVPSFPGLYIAKTKDTALQEHLGQILNNNNELTPREVALTNPASETIVSISGQLEKVFDLTNPKNLEPFLSLIDKFKISKELKTMARQLGQPNPEIIKSKETLLESLLIPNWRDIPSQFDVPANSQIFGHLICMAGIEGILYPSKLTQEPCIVVYPCNFFATGSFLELDDEPPHKKVPIRIDGSNWRISELNPDEIMY